MAQDDTNQPTVTGRQMGVRMGGVAPVTQPRSAIPTAGDIADFYADLFAPEPTPQPTPVREQAPITVTPRPEFQVPEVTQGPAGRRYIRRPSVQRVMGPTTVQRVGPGPEALAGLQTRLQAMGKLGAAAIEAKKQEVAQLEEMQTIEESKRQVMEDRRVRAEDLNARRRSAMQEMETQMEVVTEEVSAMRVEDFWSKKDTATKVLGALALGIGGYASALTGGRNQAMDVIDSAIQRDLMVQKANMEKGRARIQDLRGAYALIRQNFDDEQMADKIFHIAALEKVEQDRAALEARARTQQGKENIKVLEAQIKDNMAAHAEELFNAFQLKTVSQEQIIRDPGLTVAQREARALKEEGLVDYKELMKDTKERQMWVPGYQGFAYTVDEAKTLREASRDRSVMKSYVRKLIKYRNSISRANPAGDQRARADVLRTQAMLKKKGQGLDGLGVLAGPDLDLLASTVADPNQIVGHSVARYQELLGSIQTEEIADRTKRIRGAFNIPGRERIKSDLRTMQTPEQAEKTAGIIEADIQID